MPCRAMLCCWSIEAYQRGGRLIIPDSQPHDGGEYVCTVYFINGDRRTGYASLVVETVEPPGRHTHTHTHTPV